MSYEAGQVVWWADTKVVPCGAKCGHCRSYESAVEKMVVLDIKRVEDWGRLDKYVLLKRYGGAMMVGVCGEDVFRRRSAAERRSVVKAREKSEEAVMDCKDSREFWGSGRSRCGDEQSRLCVTGRCRRAA